jgi:WD40 repeat protein
VQRGLPEGLSFVLVGEYREEHTGVSEAVEAMPTPVTPPSHLISDGARLLAFAADGALLTCGRWPEELRRYEPESWAPRGSRKLQSPSSFLAVAPDGGYALTGEKTARAFALPALARLPLALKGHRYEVAAAATAPGGQRIATGGAGHVIPRDDTLRLWDTAGRELGRVKLPGPPKHLLWLDDQRCVVCYGASGLLCWDFAAGRELWREQSPDEGEEDALCSRGPLALSPDGRWLYVFDSWLSGTHDAGFLVLDARTGEERDRFATAPPYKSGHCFGLAVHPRTGELLASLGNNGPDPFEAQARVQRWEPATRTRRALYGHATQTQRVALSPDARWLASPLQDRSEIALWRLD